MTELEQNGVEALAWEQEGLGWTASSRAYAHDGMPFTWRANKTGNRWTLGESESELRTCLRRGEEGPYPTAEAAMAAADRIDGRYVESVKREAADTKHGPGWIDEKNPPPAGRIYHCLDGDDVVYLGLFASGGTRVAAKYADDGKPFQDGDLEIAFHVDEWNANWGDDPAVTFTDPAEQSAEPLVSGVSAPGRLPIPRSSDVSIDAIDVVHNVRGAENLFGDGLEALGDSLDTQGQIESVKLMRLPKGRFRLLDGERRYRAAKAEGIATLRAEVYDAELSDAQILRLQLTTFATRKDLTHREWAAALADYAAGGNLGPAQIARELGLKDDFVRKHLAYLDAEEAVRALVDAGKLSLNKALAIGRLPAGRQEEIAKRCRLLGWTEEELAERVNAELAGKQSGGLDLGAPAPAEPWRDDVLEKALPDVSANVISTLSAAGIQTMGDLADLQTRRGQAWADDLTGVGAAGRQQIENAQTQYWERQGSGSQETGPTDAHDLTNARRRNRAENPLPTAAQAAEARRKRAERDDAETRRREAQRKAGSRPSGQTGDVEPIEPREKAVAMGNGKIGLTETGEAYLLLNQVTVKIGSKVLMLATSQIRFDLGGAECKQLRQTLKAAAVGAAMKQSASSRAKGKPAGKGKKK